jgi:hypothetical protein
VPAIRPFRISFRSEARATDNAAAGGRDNGK